MVVLQAMRATIFGKNTHISPPSRPNMSKAWIVTLLASVGFGANLNSLIESSPPRPNIVLMLVDDLGYGDLGCFGHELVSTPNIDGLARDGVRFTRMYSQPTCSPSRAAILTGRYPVRSGMTRDRNAILYPFMSTVMDSHSLPGGIPAHERPILPEMLAAHQYKQAFIGKWHLGSGHQGKHLPLNYGFDFFYGIPDTHCSACTHDTRFRLTDADIFMSRVKGYQPAFAALVAMLLTMWSMGIAGKKTIGVTGSLVIVFLLTERTYLSYIMFNPKSCILMQNNTILEQPYKDSNMALRTTRKAMEFLSTSATGSQPFFLFMSYIQVHLPPIVSERFVNRSGLGLYYDSVTEMDWSVGKIVDTLKKLQVYNNTLIIFVSDNGPELEDPWNGAPREESLQGSTTYTVSGRSERVRLRGGKFDVWEGGIRVPAIFVWPRVIAPGSESHGLTSLMDIYPTICDALQVKCSRKKMDGKSLLPNLKNESISSPHRYLVHHCDNGGVSALSTDRYKAHFRGCRGDVFNPPLLFDIENDPGESKPLNISRHISILEEMEDEIKRHESSILASAFPSAFSETIRPWNFLCNNPPFCRKESEEEENFEDLFSEGYLES